MGRDAGISGCAGSSVDSLNFGGNASHPASFSAHGPPRFSGNCAQLDPKARFVAEGSSVGYTDKYPANFHGQSLDISNVPAGRYWLVHRANPDFHLRESHYGDDAASLLVRIAWPDGHTDAPLVTPLRVCARERC